MIRSRMPVLYTFFLFLSVACLAQTRSLYINEFMASNVLSNATEAGEYEDWIEIYNPGEQPVDLAGYYLSDDLMNRTLWKIPSGQSDKTTVPAKGFLILWADKAVVSGANHLGFKLSREKGEIALTDKNGVTLIDSISYKLQFRDISSGRYPEGTSTLYYLGGPTPGKINRPGYAGYAFPVTVDKPSGFYSDNATVSVLQNRTGDEIRYTLDGSDPTEASLPYTAPVVINKTTVFKARAFRAGDLPGQITARTYFINTNHTIPVLVMITDPKNLYDPATGIYVNDKDGREWEKYSELEYFRKNEILFHSPAGQRIQGNTGPRDFEKKSFRSYFRDGYGQEKIKNVFFPYETLTSLNRLVLRAGYDDSMLPAAGGAETKSTLLRDPLITELWRQSGELTAHSSFAVLYLNEKFHGIYDLKESIDDGFIKDHTGYADLDMMRTRYDSTELVHGSRDSWIKLVRFFESNSFETGQMYGEAEKIMDLDNFIDLQVLVHGAQYSTWSYGTFMYREKADNARFRWSIWDADRAYLDVNFNAFTTQSSTTGNWLDNLITKKLFRNQIFRDKFINRLMDQLNTVYKTENVLKIIDSLASHISQEIPKELIRWPNSEAKWVENVELLRNFARQRPSIVITQANNYFQLSGSSDITLNIKSGKGSIRVNTVMPHTYPWTGKYFNGIPLALKAIPAPGYIFIGWADKALPSKDTITVKLNGPRNFEAIFAKAGSSYAEIISPKRVRPGFVYPYIVRLRKANWGLNITDQTPLQILFGGARADTAIKIKRGAGTGINQISAEKVFSFSVMNDRTSLFEKQVSAFTVPLKYYSGMMPAGTIIWDESNEHVITSDLTVPSGCTLIIKPGTWIVVKKHVNIFVKGQLKVEGTAEDPAVITSERMNEPWGGIEFTNARADFKYCIVLNGGGDQTKGRPTNEDWHTGHQHIFFGKDDSEFNFDQCFFLYSAGKVFGAQDSRVTVTNSVSSFVWLGGEFHRVLLNYRNSHLMNLPYDDNNVYDDIDTDGFHIDYINNKYPGYSVIDSCFFITGKDDAIDHHYSRLKITNCWLEGFTHEGVAASGGDTVRIFNTVALNNDQAYEAGWTESGVSKGPFVFIDHCVAVNNNTGLRIGDSYDWLYRDYMNATNSIFYGNKDNIRNYLNSTKAPLAGALDISYSMTNDEDYNNSPFCITGTPQFDSNYYILPGTTGTGLGTNGTNMGRIAAGAGTSVPEKDILKNHSFRLEQNYPNPFNPNTKIMYTLSVPGNVQLAVYNSIGQKIRDIISSRFQAAGNYITSFDGAGLPSGIYFYTLLLTDKSGKIYSETKKMMIVK